MNHHSDDNKQKFAKLYKISLNKIGVIPHGILLPDMQKNISRNEARKNLNISTKAKVILFFGIIREYKGLDVLLEAFASITQKMPEAKLIIAGNPWEKWDKYQAIIDKNNINSFIKTDLNFIPENEIEIYFKACDVVALPYKDFDSQSGAGLLALPFGKAMIVSNLGGLTELVDDERAVFKPKDSENLAYRLLGVLKNRKLQEKLESDSKKLSEKFSWEDIGRQTLTVYKSLFKD